jgi:hypothetical protein
LFSFHLVPKPRREFWTGRMLFSGYCNPVAFLIWSMVHPHRVSGKAKRCLSSCEWCGRCPPLSPNCLTSLNLSFSPSSPPHYLLYDSITIILSAKPPHHTESSFGHRVRGNCLFLLDTSPKVIASWLFLPNSHTTLGPDLLVIHKPLTSCSSATSCRALCQFHSAHSTQTPISTGMGKTWSLHLALHGVSVCQTLTILTFGVLISHTPSLLEKTS